MADVSSCSYRWYGKSGSSRYVSYLEILVSYCTVLRIHKRVFTNACSSTQLYCVLYWLINKWDAPRHILAIYYKLLVKDNKAQIYISKDLQLFNVRFYNFYRKHVHLYCDDGVILAVTDEETNSFTDNDSESEGDTETKTW